MGQCVHCGRSEKDEGRCAYCGCSKVQDAAWLIEIDRSGNDGKHWPAVATYIFVDHKGAFGFTTDHDRGIRFSRRMDAERLIMLLLGMEFPSAGRYAAVGYTCG